MALKKGKTPSAQLSGITTRLFSNCFEKESRHVAKFNITLVESRCLRILFDLKSLAVKDLAHHMTLSSSRITRVIDGLVDKKLVVRQPAENDRRMFILSLSKKGENLTRRLITTHEELHKEILNGIPPHYQEQIINSIDMLNKAIEEWLSRQ